MGEAVVTLPYKARAAFRPYHARKQRWAFLLAHRRAGKTVVTVVDMIKRALRAPREARFAYIAPYHVQAKDIAWLYLKRFTAPLMGFGLARSNESDLSVTLPEGQIIRLYGAENGERIRGLGLDGVVLDEYADFPPYLWGEVLRPALSDRQGWATFIGTPKGMSNDFYVKREEARAEGWFYAELKASETGILPQEELDAARSQMTADQYAQEYECSFDAAIHGAIYNAELATLRAEGRICRVPYDPILPVHTVWDLGVGDATAIGFYQVVRGAGEIRAIDYYEAQGEGLPHYASVLRGKPYTYGKHHGPHDIQVREFGSGRSRLEVAAGLGITFEVVPNVALEDGIHAARMMLPKCWFDEIKCRRWVEALANYRWAENKALGELRSTPVHNWASHPADMTRYMALSIRDEAPAKPRHRRASGGWMAA